MTAKVLVVEDDPSILSMVATRLRSRGFVVLEAVDGRAGLGMARKEQPDVVVLDVMMPKMTGWEVAQALRADDTTKHVKIVMLTAIGEDIEPGSAAAYGVDAYFDKPFHFGQLVDKISELAP